jgi:glycosyltransferase involved in cell wall biosynthesis
MQLPASTMPSSPTPLAFVITELEPGGAERNLVELVTRIDRSRFSPAVYSLGPSPYESRSSLVSRLSQAEIPTHFLGFTKLWQYSRAVRWLADLLQDQGAQVVQTFLFHANVIGTRAARVAGVPNVVNGIRVADPRWWRLLIERVAISRAARYVCVSQSVAEYYRRSGFAADKLVVIPNGIDIRLWSDVAPRPLSDFGIPAGRQVILFIGRLDRQKGLDRFFYELPQVFRDLPNHDLLLVGEGPLRASVARRARHLKMQNRVYFAGWQPEIPPIMAAADVLVLPSRWEGMPNVVLEAMAAGKPVVATQSEGTVELLGLAALEQTVPVDDWVAFHSQLAEIARNETLANELGQRNRARAAQFSLDAVTARYQRLYETLLSAPVRK